jgi:hypothetical protein
VVGQTGAVDATGRPPAPVRLVEVLAALALATDLGMGQPLGHAIRSGEGRDICVDPGAAGCSAEGS